MPAKSIALASVKSFGDFVIAHSVLHGIERAARDRTRLIGCIHVAGLNAVLPAGVRVTLIDSHEKGVPALFDVKKHGPFAAMRSALSLRREFRNISRDHDEVLAFDALGLRERFIAGRWLASRPRILAGNIYATYSRMLAEEGFRSELSAPPERIRLTGSVGIFPESRLIEKRLGAATLAVILDRAARAKLNAKLFILEGDSPLPGSYSCQVNIARNFESLMNAIQSVDCVVSADSLPAHLAEYCRRPAFVALRASNDYWLPYGCFTEKRWGIFRDEAQFSGLLDKFLTQFGTAGGHGES